MFINTEYKNYDNFKKGTGVCYKTENKSYDYNDLLNICGNEKHALEILDLLKGEEPEKIYNQLKEILF